MKNKITLSALLLSLVTTIVFSQEKENTSTINFDPVVISGTLKAIKKSQSPVPVTIIPSQVLSMNPTSNILEALYQINGLNPQVNCNMCNTSDISINGMPGPYTMVLMDGMPIVSSLSTVYGFNGIPNALIKQIEVVKGPASSLYGSEAIGGVINIITRDANERNTFFTDYSVSSWKEFNFNVGFSRKISNNISTLFSIDNYYYNTPKDQDMDGFMDKTLQKRFSAFNKWNFINRKYNKHSSFYVRYYHEDRHGGELNWNPHHQFFVDYKEYNNDENSSEYNADAVLPNGYTIYNQDKAKGFRVPRGLSSQEIKNWKENILKHSPNTKFADDMKYQESITTNRYEIVGKYELPLEENITLQGSYNQHNQNSTYGTELFIARQKTMFLQAYWDKEFGNHNLLAGMAHRYTWFEDNTTATHNGKTPFVTQTPGIFIQDLWKTGKHTTLLLGYRLDIDKTKSANNTHTNVVHSPRIAFKYQTPNSATLRTSVGSGYRVVNIFSEDHRALSGQYTATLGETLKPEKSLSATIDYDGRMATENFGLTYNLGLHYTHFFNKIYPKRNDRERTLIYYNVDGDEYAKSLGATLDIALNFYFPLKLTAGITYNKAQLVEHEREQASNEKIKGSQRKAHDFEFSPRWMGVYSASYLFPKNFITELTGEWKGPMLLPIQENDPRPKYSPWFMKVNLQLIKKLKEGLEIYGGVKNLFNYVPGPYLVDTQDPFGDIESPLEFDTEYNYTPQQGRTGYLGLRYAF